MIEIADSPRLAALAQAVARLSCGVGRRRDRREPAAWKHLVAKAKQSGYRVELMSHEQMLEEAPVLRVLERESDGQQAAGFCDWTDRRLIGIDCELDCREAVYVLAHELSHGLLKQTDNRMRTLRQMGMDRGEEAADLLAEKLVAQAGLNGYRSYLVMSGRRQPRATNLGPSGRGLVRQALALG